MRPSTLCLPLLVFLCSLWVLGCPSDRRDRREPSPTIICGAGERANPVTGQCQPIDGYDAGGTGPVTDAGPLPDVGHQEPIADPCEACTAEQVCLEGACVDVPQSCPCPKETYCDLSQDRCVVGCIGDDDCDQGRICYADERQCRPGCRQDTQCNIGQICENLGCQTGCRADAECGAGQICHQLTCQTGCRQDSDCTGAGQICDDRACRPGCRGDQDCPGADSICAQPQLICTTGCRENADCPIEQVCDTNIDQCVSGCEDDAGCQEGRICDEGLCRGGCREHSDCPLRHYCTEDFECASGCGPDGWYAGMADRCEFGEACVPRSCSGDHCNWQCQPNCYGWTCRSEPGQEYSCFGGSSAGARCRKNCSSDGQCEGDQKCTWFTTNASVPGNYGVRYCATPCSSDGDCANTVDSYGRFNDSCICRDDGICRFTEQYVCYQLSPTYGL